MNTYPLKSLTLEEATNLQFKLVDSITRFFPGNEILTRGDLGVVKGLNQPITTKKTEETLAHFFGCESALLVRGSGTNAIRLALHSAVGTGKTILVHQAPIYPTTKVSIDMLGINTIEANFNDLSEVKQCLNKHEIDGVLIQVTRQKIDDFYDLEELIGTIKSVDKTIPIVTDDNYSALKTKGIGSQLGGNLACFSTFKLLGPEGIGCIVGDKIYLDKLKQENYSGGGQVQGHEALDVLKGLIYAPVSLAISSKVSEELCDRINKGEVPGLESAFVVNAQSKVVVINLKENNAKKIIEAATTLGALPHPVGAESKYEFAPLVYRVSGTFRSANPLAEDSMIRINPNRAGVDTIIRILKKAMSIV
ncbi:aminotransferase class V-fold PLP-dependent enzyme [Vagococcus xieshaowenii]|uniref:Aminotransferase class V-fold PLP-dependent enzyme n=1 Tax=Vagococcus xieshaowenii TaxID=2562451 RepID=A0AAJ5JMF5_9ENTE|nr:aminotransferase class V-fold PLP-dependent enzyme [Vagococcus xieshaowenii]QCA28874.1 aminotransferase class V-fold PLP-dependent enzyme [Vagococcus xieshaowenii]TFZ43291.1 aminotransferase class V-fold PLP-dependent enzyme [Vagococcus xieshaowenii]